MANKWLQILLNVSLLTGLLIYSQPANAESAYNTAFLTTKGRYLSGALVDVDGVSVTPATRAAAGQFGFGQSAPTAKTVGIEAGHSSSDPGASSCDGVYHEANVTYDIAQRLQQKLTSAGYQVTLFRENKGAIAGSTFDAFIALHVDYCPGGYVSGYKAGRYGGAAGTGLLGNGDASDRLTQAIWDNYGAATGIPQDRSSGHFTNNFRYYFALAGARSGVSAQTPSAILEMGWMRDPDLSKLINNPDSMATGIYNALNSFLGGGGGDPCSTPSPNADQAALYEHANYCGAYVVLNSGEWPNPGALGFANDTASSVKVGSNVRLSLCKDDNYAGGCEDFTGDDPNLQDNTIGNDQVSSARLVTRQTVPADQDIIVNGVFDSNTLDGWQHWGDLAYAFYGSGVLYFKREANGGGGSIYQTWNYFAPASTPFEVNVQFGNTSNVTKTPSVHIRSSGSWDGIHCYFSVPPNTGLTSFRVRGLSPADWNGFTVEVWPDPPDGTPDVLMDNISLAARPGLALSATECQQDTTAPSGEVILPEDGSSFSAAAVEFTAQANDNADGSGVKEVEFHVGYDGAWHLVGTDTTYPYGMVWNVPAGLAPQDLIFTLHITDLAGNEVIDPGGYHHVRFVSACQDCGPADTPWAMFRGDPRHTARSALPGPAAPPEIAWQRETTSGHSSSPVIDAQGNLYVGLGSKLIAYTSSGQELWQFQAADVVNSPALTQNGVIYVGSDDHNLYAINQSTGGLLWQYSATDRIAGSPTISPQGMVYFGSWDSHLYALHPDGTLAWSYGVGSWIQTTPAIAEDGAIYFGSSDNWVYALTPSGALKWKFATSSYIDSSPAIGADGVIYIGSCDGYLYAISPDGALRWKYQTAGSVNSSPALGLDGAIYIGSADGSLYALNPDGSLRWSYPTDGAIYSSPVTAADGVIFISANDGYLYAINPDGTRQWRIQPAASWTQWAQHNPVIGPDRQVYVSSHSPGGIYAVRQADRSDTFILTAVGGISGIQLNWPPLRDPNISGYLVQRIAENAQDLTDLATLQDTNYYDSDSSLQAGLTYCYEVVGLVNNGADVVRSNRACAEFGQTSLWIPDTRAAPGATLIVPVNIRNATGLQIAACDIWVEYDGSLLQLTEISRTVLTAGYSWDYSIENAGSSSLARIISISSPPPILYGDGSLFWLKFKVLGTDSASSTIRLREFIEGIGGSKIHTPADLYNPIPLALQNGGFQVSSSFILGDLNGNGVVESADAYLVLQIASHQITPSAEQIMAGDINGNGLIDAADATMILYYAAHQEWPLAGGLPAMTQAVQATPGLRLGEANGAPGETVTLLLSGDDLANVAGGEFEIIYDPQVVDSIVSVSPAGLGDGFTLTSHADGQGGLRIALAGMQEISGNGALVSIQFQLASGLSAGVTSPLVLIGARLNDLSGRDFASSALQLPVSRQNGLLTILGLPAERLYLPYINQR